MRAIVFTRESLSRLHNFGITDEWFSEFGLPSETTNLKRVEIDGIVYILERYIDNDNTPIIIINCDGEDKVFEDGLPNFRTLDRIITSSESIYNPSVTIPYTWRPYHERNIFSIYSASRSKAEAARIHFERNPRDSNDLFVFSRTPETVNFHNLERHPELYHEVRENFTDAVLVEPDENAPVTSAGIVLSQRLPHGFVQGATLEQWYGSKLTDEQLKFVDKPYDGPVRLRGSAGTGKTLSMIIKFLRDGQRFEKDGIEWKMGFLTHSAATVELVNALAESLDPSGLVYGRGKFCRLEVRTLYDLAHERLDFELRSLQPLSLDGREGRQLQFELILEALKEVLASSVGRARFGDLSPPLLSRWQAAAEGKDRRFIAEIMNEFASVLDAEKIRWGEESADKYIKGVGSRPSWLLELPSEVDRTFILEIHRIYRRMLSEMKTLSIDQMVADFNSFLNTTIWDIVREEQGYDALFVDELHLFTSIERQILHKCIKRHPDEDGKPQRPPIFMAYDIKQSPTDSFTEYFESRGSIFTSSSNLQNSDLVQLSKVFRYTPEIAEFLHDIDASFPAIDIPGEWGAYVGEPQLTHGATPQLVRYKDDLALLRGVFQNAIRLARQIGGRRVAVLSVSEELFDAYQGPCRGQYRGRVFPVTDREESAELRHVGKRFVFSMPEYVAGLQFDTVFLIHVNANEAPADARAGTRRQFISSVYLGASRAEKTLKICSSEAHGGPSDILDLALQRKSLIEAQN